MNGVPTASSRYRHAAQRMFTITVKMHTTTHRVGTRSECMSGGGDGGGCLIPSGCRMQWKNEWKSVAMAQLITS